MSEAYKQAGVNIDAGNEAVNRMKKHVKATFRPEVLTEIGGFGALFSLDTKKYKEPILVSGTDGVGTKLKIAFAMNRHDTIGIDAVAMCVNDIVVQGAEPLFFLDYLACDQVIPEKIEEIVKGISDGCKQAGCALIGGETAEMPGIYGEGEYDIAGFVVGVVEKEKMVDGRTIAPGDALIGLSSSGIHSNGYSLVRKVLIQDQGLTLQQKIPQLEKTLGEELLTPTRIYVKTILSLLQRFNIKGMAHITGGGFIENIPRILPDGAAVEIDYGSWPVPAIFQLIEEYGNIDKKEMFRTFNMGIGMVLVIPNGQVMPVMNFLSEQNERAYYIGRVIEGKKGVRFGGITL
ncbi:phosphoribosylformylglycinamidine cyclo-ligase [Microaerobacter geothermalis]|uniref:phosphoribosylformylglycinamidine cyclo-ligase n=1 Tax=Microaerobacter geothermalis TaxID=674972 RepID=UPI001F33D562|nr:phosphoribosylformylglycinamidine cyclo-ligase [Microaerobacter geothermalis]MCF6094485.1 phosphoribosylformylglycinamidine cyclo-ligase [Microaerobacter geothermalis]